MRVGISVKCTVCHMTKQPHGRSAPFGSFYCANDCKGYHMEPLPGCLWPNETEKDFGYIICEHATKVMELNGVEKTIAILEVENVEKEVHSQFLDRWIS